MKRSLVLGSIAGILLTVIAAYFLLNSNSMKAAGGGAGSASSTQEDISTPLVAAFAWYSSEFPGQEDLLAHRSTIQPFASIENWDKAVESAGHLVLKRLSWGCEVVAPTRAIFVPPEQSAAVQSGKINLHFISPDVTRCFGTGWKITVVEDNLVDGKSLYKILGEATIDRLIEARVHTLPDAFFDGVKVNRVDVGYLTNPNYGPVTEFGPFTAIHFTMSPTRPLLDPNVIPPFVPGADSVKPNALKKLFEGSPRLGRPILVDARDRSTVTANYPGAIAIPFVPSNPIQLRFQLEFPFSLLAGAKFDLRALPAAHDTRLVVFGADNTDASPLWVIRALRQQNYHRLFYVEGGFKELSEIKPPVRF